LAAGQLGRRAGGQRGRAAEQQSSRYISRHLQPAGGREQKSSPSDPASPRIPLALSIIYMAFLLISLLAAAAAASLAPRLDNGLALTPPLGSVVTSFTFPAAPLSPLLTPLKASPVTLYHSPLPSPFTFTLHLHPLPFTITFHPSPSPFTIHLHPSPLTPHPSHADSPRWNSYNHYSCAPNETIVHSNAQALVDLGLQALGYHFVTVDCGWTLPNRSADGTLPWNPDRFPQGGKALGDYIHGLGLGFGMYSDAGIKMCMTGEPQQAGSLSSSRADRRPFVCGLGSGSAEMYVSPGLAGPSRQTDSTDDNCYSEASSGYPVTDYAPVVSAAGRYANMSAALASTNRPMLFQICNWGVDFPSAWAPELSHSWRITNDIIPAYRTIPRILNQAVPQTSFAGPGRWLDLDMLEVGNGFFTIPEEQTQFSTWAIIKSPLIIGAALKDAYRTISADSLAILMNADVIGYNQDALGVAASFRRRWTEDGYELWAGPLTGGRTVVALVNLKNEARRLTFDLADAGMQSAGSVKDIWNKVSAVNVLTSYTASVGAHGTILLELASTTPAGFYSALDALVSGTSTTFRNIYGQTTSSSYTGTLRFNASRQAADISINGVSHTLPAEATSISFPLTLAASSNNTLSLVSPFPPTDLVVGLPEANLYPATSFQPSPPARLVTCNTGLCDPVGSKISSLSPTGLADLSVPAPPGAVDGSKYVRVLFANNDIALATAWQFGTNTRNLTISVNTVVTRIEVPLSGRSSELFSPGDGWEDTGVFGVLLPGWKGSGAENMVVVGNQGGEGGLVEWAADFVGLEVLW
ncbi:hypothetical protein JHW43_002710, partial [Diplocarpon mali]